MIPGNCPETDKERLKATLQGYCKGSWIIETHPEMEARVLEPCVQCTYFKKELLEMGYLYSMDNGLIKIQ